MERLTRRCDQMRNGGPLIAGNGLARQRFALLAIVAAVTVFVPWAVQLDGSESPSNIVLFLIDDLGWRDLGCYGSTFYETPSIDRLAAEGMRFDQAYAAAPVCSPTRASILTGRNPARLGFTGHITAILRYRFPPRGRILPPQDNMRLRLEEVTLAEVLSDLGYATSAIGKWHLGPPDHWPQAQGFDLNIAGNTHGSPPSYFDPYVNEQRTWSPTLVSMEGRRPGEYLTDRLTDEAIEFIQSHRDRPFFLYLSHYAVHTPIQAKRDLTRKYQAKLETDRSQKNPAYAAMIESVDQSVGRVMECLDRLKLSENTIVVFFSDNGGLSSVTNNAPLRGGKQTLYEGGIRVPLIIKSAGVTSRGAVCQTPVHSDDLLPTLLELVQRADSVPGTIDGQSLVPLLTGTNEFAKRRLYWYYPHYARRPGAVVRDGDLKLIEHFDPPTVELYNLGNDLSESHDLSETMPERATSMREDLRRWLRAVGAVMHRENPDYEGR